MPSDTITLQPITRENWRAALALGVRSEQQRFIANYAPIAAVVLAKAYVGAGGLVWEPLLLLNDATPVGFVALASADGRDDECTIYHFFIDARHQGRGVGRRALAATLAHLRATRPTCRTVALTVHPENAAAQRLYRSTGFAPTGETRDDEPVYALRLDG